MLSICSPWGRKELDTTEQLNWTEHLYLGSPCCSVPQLCPAVCNLMDGSTPGFLVLHHLLKFAQTLVCRVGDAIQPSHPLSSPSPDFNLSQHQGLFQWVGSSHQVAKVLELQLQYQAFQRTFMDTLILFLKFSDHPVLFLHLLQSLHYCVNLVFLREVSRGLLQTSELAFINRFPKSSPNQWLGVMEIRTWQESLAQTLRSSL